MLPNTWSWQNKPQQKVLLLLKNDGTLPALDEKRIKTLLITGPMAHAAHDQLGTWVF